jgi:PAS domain S-box-containing protein
MRMMEVRAVENFAAAPATPADRRSALLSVLGLLALFVLSIPFARVRLDVVPAFLPAVVGAGIVALTLTTLLLYLQYRIERDLRLALLYIAYAYAAVTQLLYILTFPGLFSRTGMLGAGPQTSGAFFLASQLGFCMIIVAQGLAARFDWKLTRDRVRLLVTALVLFTLAQAVLFTLGHDLLPELVAGNRISALDSRMVRPLIIAGYALAIIVVGDRWRTVTQTWLSVVLLARMIDLFTTGELSGIRFSVGWYTARLEGLLASIVILAVFLVKYNGLMLRLAARNRSTAEALEIGEARYASLANVVPQLIFTTSAQGELEYVNDRWTAYTGQSLEETREHGWRGVFHPDHDLMLRDRWLHALRTGEPFSVECRIREMSGRFRWFLVNVAPVRGRGDETMAWIGTCTDIDTQKRLEEREAFLARAGERLGASLDVNATVAGIKALLVPRLADRCWIALLDEEGSYALSGVGSSDVAEEFEARRWIGSPLQPALHDAVARIVEHGEPVVVDHLERFPDPWLHGGAACAMMVVPLVNGELAVGVLAMARDDRLYDADDLGVVREFARRAALSLRHARLYLRERTTADALQRAMLPAQLPLLPDIRFSASYSAASESQRVGGDFYDAFELPDGRVALTIGDVTGHGLEAAVIMGEIRQALRAASFERAEPSVILDRASRLLVASGRTVFVTAIFGVFDPVSGDFSYATAGHPPPLLEQGGTLRRLPTAGLPIGLRDGEGVDFGWRLHAPCTLVLYTDGLLEFGRDIAEGERRIDAAMRELAADQIEHLAAALMKAVLAEDEPTDDIAILTVTIDRVAQQLPGEAREWRFSTGDARTAALVRREVGELITAWTGREDIRFAAELAYGELIANVVRYAPGIVRVEVSCDAQGNALLVVDDQGAGFTPAKRPPDPFAESGRGLILVSGVADEMTIEASPSGGTRVCVAFRSQPAFATSA